VNHLAIVIWLELPDLEVSDSELSQLVAFDLEKDAGVLQGFALENFASLSPMFKSTQQLEERGHEMLKIAVLNRGYAPKLFQLVKEKLKQTKGNPREALILNKQDLGTIIDFPKVEEMMAKVCVGNRRKATVTDCEINLEKGSIVLTVELHHRHEIDPLESANRLFSAL
jgi:hypothetical protein